MARRRAPAPPWQFELVLPPRPLHPMPDTSRAARRATPARAARRAQMQQRILHLLEDEAAGARRAHHRPTGCTASELHAELGRVFGVDLYEVRRRVSDLRRANAVRQGGRRGTTALGASEVAWLLAADAPNAEGR